MSGWQKIVCASDLSPAADEAIRQADRLARASGGQLTLLHVVPSGFPGVPMSPQGMQRTMEDRERLSSEVIDALLDRASSLTGRTADELDVVVEDGAPYAAIVTRAEALGADLLVLGSVGGSGLSRLVLGSVADRVVRLAHSSVLIARPGRPGGVLAAVDFSEKSVRALNVAADEARRRGVKVAGIHCVEFATAGLALVGDGNVSAPPTVAPRTLLEEMRTTAQARLEQELAAVGGGDALVVDEAPPVGIARAAEAMSADLVVMGTSGRTGLSRMLLGSVAEKVVHSAPCSVLVVRT